MSVTAQKKSWYRMEASKEDAKTYDIWIFDYIGYWGISARDFIQELQQIPEDVTVLNVRMNSGGGEVFDGLAIYHSLKSHKATVNVYITGLAASIASIIALAGDKVVMSEDSYFMVHKPSYGWWNADDLRELIAEFTKDITLLDGIEENLVAIYTKETGMETKDVAAMVQATTWLKASEAKEKGFIDEVGDPVKATASYASLELRGVTIPETLRAGCSCTKNAADKKAGKKSFIDQVRDFLKIGTPKAGAKLSEKLNATIDSMVTEEKTRDAIINDMATVSSQTTDQVNADIDGSNKCPKLGILVAYSTVLTTTYLALKEAAEADGCDYSEEEKEAEDTKEAEDLLKSAYEKLVASETQLAASQKEVTQLKDQVKKLNDRVKDLEKQPGADPTKTTGGDHQNKGTVKSQLSDKERQGIDAVKEMVNPKNQ
jgi:ATP-dependent protease ClpP protease subunit/uncharacterized coiled-coil protein SlyX